MFFSPRTKRILSRRRRPVVEVLEERIALHCNSPDPFICTPLDPTHDNLAMHIHPRLRIVVNGQEQAIPANIGIELGSDGQPVSFLPIHTHDNSGVLHVESPVQKDFYLRNFFEVWDQPFSREQILGFRTLPNSPVQMTVNGQPSQAYGDLLLQNGQLIEITASTNLPNLAGALQFDPATYSVAANAGSVTITITRSNGALGAISVAYATSDGTARAGVDYVAASGRVEFAQSELSKTITVSILNASAAESRVFTLTLSDPGGGATLGTQTTATVTITSARPPVNEAANRAYVAQVYRDFYGREADAADPHLVAGVCIQHLPRPAHPVVAAFGAIRRVVQNEQELHVDNSLLWVGYTRPHEPRSNIP